MGLSSKQVSSDRHGWSQALLQSNTLELPKLPSMKRQSSQQQQQQQQQVEQLKCPRCESTNTKFCYYNNYNKSQPRHFCKACKRHWTKGGTLRNVPVGGGRKNKRLKSSNSGAKPASKTTTTTTTNTTTTNENLKRLIQSHQQQPQPPPRFSLPLGASASLLGGYDEKNSFSDAFYQALVRQPPTSLTDNSIIFNNSKALNDANNGIFLGATISLPHHTSTNSNSINDQDHLQFPYSNLGSFDNNPCSISSSNFYNLNGDQATVMEDSLMNNTSLELSSSSLSDHHQPWTTTTTTPATAAATTTTTTTTTNSMIDISSNWGWDDFDKFVSVDADLTMPWDDTEIKPPGS